MPQVLRRWLRRALLATALATVAGLAFGLAAPQPSDAQASGAPGYQQVSAGDLHTCAVSEAGAVACSGWNADGRTSAPAGRYRQVSAGGDHTCALTEAGAVVCWGSNTYAQADAPEERVDGKGPAADPPRPTIGERHDDGHFPVSFGGATLGQLKASGLALIVEGRPSSGSWITGRTDPYAVFPPARVGHGSIQRSPVRSLAATVRDEIDHYLDYDGDEHGSLAIPDLTINVLYTQTPSMSVRFQIKITLVPAEGEHQVASQTFSTAPPAAPAIDIASALRGDADQVADLGQIAELAIGLQVVPPFRGNEGAQTNTCLSALAAAPTSRCPSEVPLGADSRLRINGPATFQDTGGSKLLQGRLRLRCEPASDLLGGAGAACFIVRDHYGIGSTPAPAPRIRINDDAARDVSIDASIVAPDGMSFYAQLMNADGLRPLYHRETGSYYPLEAEYAGGHIVFVNCELVGETEAVISGATAGSDEARVIERVRTRQCATSAGAAKTFIQRIRYIADAADWHWLPPAAPWWNGMG